MNYQHNYPRETLRPLRSQVMADKASVARYATENSNVMTILGDIICGSTLAECLQAPPLITPAAGPKKNNED
jgi:hypothetical protein